jgi:hypothetical protein
MAAKKNYHKPPEDPRTIGGGLKAQDSARRCFAGEDGASVVLTGRSPCSHSRSLCYGRRPPCCVESRNGCKSLQSMAFPTDLGLQHTIFRSVSLFFCLLPGSSSSQRLVSEDCVRHHPVLTNSGGFRVKGIRREFNGLGGLNAVYSRGLAHLHVVGWKRPPVSKNRRLPSLKRQRNPSSVISISRFEKRR